MKEQQQKPDDHQYFHLTNTKKNKQTRVTYVGSLTGKKRHKTRYWFKKNSRNGQSQGCIEAVKWKIVLSTTQTFYSVLCESQSLSHCTFTLPASSVLLHWFSFKFFLSHRPLAVFALKQMTVYKKRNKSLQYVCIKHSRTVTSGFFWLWMKRYEAWCSAELRKLCRYTRSWVGKYELKYE